jgi:hypothetical protein
LAPQSEQVPSFGRNDLSQAVRRFIWPEYHHSLPRGRRIGSPELEQFLHKSLILIPFGLAAFVSDKKLADALNQAGYFFFG